ncbi:glycine cleavage system H protein [Barrientosiimonas humi]|uniref:Glycine cleavage system H protein n=2 Tax=Barrientosiimonas TaxID=1535207 RepID=A0A542XBJ1_9MICO|nr:MULTISPECIES: glycine cleavage system protein GcvH [Barrientosiimonas]TQL33144.1 glycine cleavage system H protein [Barrientosiimonas humi]BDZ58025.1 glycine cleavage system H protein [Barrientosiimonas endolithica]CAG7573133.1 Glycine cleavage system H protein [Barrientosiimonas humi]
MSDLEYPANLRYTSDHEWVADRGEGIVRVGVTAYAQDALGDVVYVSLPNKGDTVAAGDSCGEVESTKSVSDLYSPLDGEVTTVNDALESSPELVNSDPYGDGWMYEMSVADSAAIGELMDADAYRSSLA